MHCQADSSPLSHPGSLWTVLLLFSYSAVSSSFHLRGRQHARFPCPSPSSAGCSNSCPLMPCSHLVLCHPLLLLPSIFHGIRVSSNESALRIRWPKYWSFNFSISPSNEYSGLISFRVDWIKPEDLSLKRFATTIFPIRTHSFLFQHFINVPGAFFHPSSQERREVPDWQGCKKLSLSARDRSSHPLSANHRSTYGPAWAWAWKVCLIQRENISCSMVWKDEQHSSIHCISTKTDASISICLYLTPYSQWVWHSGDKNALGVGHLNTMYLWVTFCSVLMKNEQPK